ncbi:(+)-neomenthol dehydrogenase-like [Lolium rigidum]|uniref:(+)-neomenthol dehydrogenase-like n=1 Tax=Lolium rigidum TaxID=89674 RepID=UPI001F5CAD47|nr:(+)-neomenthol dehydrogenase-like [Lolium rigidum]
MEGAIISRSPNTRVAVVTGGNKGIGLEVCRQLADNGVSVVLMARDEARGMAAVEKLKALGLSDIVFHQLEVTDASSIDRLAAFLESRFRKLDILVNNAATGGNERLDDVIIPGVEKFDGMDVHQRLEWMKNNTRETHEAAKQGVQTNYYGTKHVTEALLPLLLSSSDGRIVNVSSSFGLLITPAKELPCIYVELRRQLDDINSLTEKRLDKLLDAFLGGFDDSSEPETCGRGRTAGFSAYKVAKAAVNAYTRMLARRHPALRVNCVHPGYVRTDFSMNSGLLSPEEGARGVVKLALLPNGGPTGAYFAEGQLQVSFV